MFNALRVTPRVMRLKHLGRLLLLYCTLYHVTSISVTLCINYTLYVYCNRHSNVYATFMHAFTFRSIPDVAADSQKRSAINVV